MYVDEYGSPEKNRSSLFGSGSATLSIALSTTALSTLLLPPNMGWILQSRKSISPTKHFSHRTFIGLYDHVFKEKNNKSFIENMIIYSSFFGRIHVTCFHLVYTHSYICVHQYLHLACWFPCHRILVASVGGLADKSESQLYTVSNNPYPLPIKKLRHVKCLRPV